MLNNTPDLRQCPFLHLFSWGISLSIFYKGYKFMKSSSKCPLWLNCLYFANEELTFFCKPRTKPVMWCAALLVTPSDCTPLLSGLALWQLPQTRRWTRSRRHYRSLLQPVSSEIPSELKHCEYICTSISPLRAIGHIVGILFPWVLFFWMNLF